MTWEERKEIIRGYLVEGWSIAVAFKKSGYGTEYYNLPQYKTDLEFREEVQKYLKRPRRAPDYYSKEQA